MTSFTGVRYQLIGSIIIIIIYILLLLSLLYFIIIIIKNYVRKLMWNDNQSGWSSTQNCHAVRLN